MTVSSIWPEQAQRVYSVLTPFITQYVATAICDCAKRIRVSGGLAEEFPKALEHNLSFGLVHAVNLSLVSCLSLAKIGGPV